MRPNAKNLAMRDTALAILVGAHNPADFGAEANDSFGAEFGDDWGLDDDFEGDDDDWGAEFGAAALAKPTPSKVQQVWKKHATGQARAQKRALILEPNRGSSVKVERYSFSIDQDIVLGTASDINMTGQPDTTIRPQTVTMNAPTTMFATISNIKVANVSVTVGPGNEDAYNYNANGWGRNLDMPTLSPANRATVTGRYTGFVPAGFVGGQTVNFNASFKGPASIVA